MPTNPFLPSGFPSNFPTPPSTNRGAGNLKFPSDLITDDRNLYTQIFMQQYSPNFGYSMSAVDGVILPIPKTLNDLQVMVWQEHDALSIGAQLGGLALGSLKGAFGGIIGQAIGAGASQAANLLGGITAGVSINPMLWMLFKSPAFKDHTLRWTLAAKNPQESKNIANIINYLKKAALPKKRGPLYEFPDIAIIRLMPSDTFTFKFKPCAIIAIQTDYNGAGSPAFFKGTNAPVMINLTIQLKEIELWTKDNYNEYSTSLITGESFPNFSFGNQPGGIQP